MAFGRGVIGVTDHIAVVRARELGGPVGSRASAAE